MPGQIYSVGTFGGHLSAPYLSERIRHAAQPELRLRQFVDVVEAIGKGRGDTWYYDKISNVMTAGGTLVETSTIPETNFVVNRGTGVITEYGNAIPYTFKLSALSQIEVEPHVEIAIRNDQVKVLDSAAGREYTKTEFVAVAVSTSSVVFTTNGTATATASANLTAANTRAIVDFMKKRLVPKYDGQNYVCVASISAISGMHGDTSSGGWVDVSKYTADYAKNIFNGEVGKYYGCRFVEESNFLSNTIGSNAAFGQALFFGADSVVEAVAVPEEIRLKTSVDYGRDLGMAWYALLGFKIVWNFATDNEQHIVFMTSA